VDADSGGLGFPRMADSIEYSRFAASEPKVYVVGSKGALRRESSCGKESARGGLEDNRTWKQL
jgi:hypothetical protein